MKVGFLGLGAMGSPIAANIARAGHELNVFDVDAAKAEALRSEGARVFPAAAEMAAASELVFSSLPNGRILEGVMLGEAGIVAAAAPGTVLVDLSSVSPKTSRAVAAAAAARGIGFLDAPVSGGTAGAVAGTLTIMVGGKAEHFDKARPVLEKIGKKIFHVGEVGTGAAIKIVNNSLLGCHMAALAEAFALAKKCGIDAQTMLDIVGSSSGNSYVLGAKMKQFIMEDKFDGGFAVNLQYKDLGLALEAAADAGLPMTMAERASGMFREAIDAGYGAEDISSVVKLTGN